VSAPVQVQLLGELSVPVDLGKSFHTETLGAIADRMRHQQAQDEKTAEAIERLLHWFRGAVVTVGIGQNH
jgi:hypothetical protein